MAIEMLYFAWVRERVGVGQERVDPPADVTSVSELIDWLGRSSAGHARAFEDRSRLRAAVDQVSVPLDALLGHAGEVAIFPPVTGG